MEKQGEANDFLRPVEAFSVSHTTINLQVFSSPPPLRDMRSLNKSLQVGQ